MQALLPGHHMRKMILCKVARGNVLKTDINMDQLTDAPEGHHSVHGVAKVDGPLNYDEIVVYKEAAILPFAIVTYEFEKLTAQVATDGTEEEQQGAALSSPSGFDFIGSPTPMTATAANFDFIATSAAAQPAAAGGIDLAAFGFPALAPTAAAAPAPTPAPVMDFSFIAAAPDPAPVTDFSFIAAAPAPPPADLGAAGMHLAFMDAPAPAGAPAAAATAAMAEGGQMTVVVRAAAAIRASTLPRLASTHFRFLAACAQRCVMFCFADECPLLQEAREGQEGVCRVLRLALCTHTPRGHTP